MSIQLEVPTPTLCWSLLLMWVGWYTQLEAKAVPPLLAVIMVPLALVYACATGRLDELLASGLSHVDGAFPEAEQALEEAKKRLAEAEKEHEAKKQATKKANMARESWSKQLQPARQTRNAAARTNDERADLKLGIDTASKLHQTCLTAEGEAKEELTKSEKAVKAAQKAVRDAEHGETVKNRHFALYVMCLVSMVLGSGYILGFSPQIVAAEFDFLKCFPGPEFKECMRSAECRQSNLTDADCTLAKQQLPTNISGPICSDPAGYSDLYQWTAGVVCQPDESDSLPRQMWTWSFCSRGHVSCTSRCVSAALARCDQQRRNLGGPTDVLTTFGCVLAFGVAMLTAWYHKLLWQKGLGLERKLTDAIGLGLNWEQPASEWRPNWAACVCAAVQPWIQPHRETDAFFWTFIVLGVSVFILRVLLNITNDRQTQMTCYAMFRMSFLVHLGSMVTEVVRATLAIGTRRDGSVAVYCVYFAVTLSMAWCNPLAIQPPHQGMMEMFLCSTPVLWVLCLVPSRPEGTAVLIAVYVGCGYGVYCERPYDELLASKKMGKKYSTRWHQFLPHVFGVLTVLLQGMVCPHNPNFPVYGVVWFAVVVCQFAGTCFW